MDPRAWLAIHLAQRIRTAILRHKLRKATRDGKITDCDLVIQEAYVTYDQWEGVLRHALTFGGGFAVAAGWLSATDLASLIGAIVTIAGVWHSIRSKRKAS